MPVQTGVLALLDELQAAEQAGVAALGRWIAACQDPPLRGGLRIVRARDVAHAALALERMRELGGEPAGAPVPRLDALCGILGAPEPSDRGKVHLLLARFPRSAHDPFASVLPAIADDDETRSMLETIRDDDRLSVEWLRRMEDAPPVVPRERVGARERADVVAFLSALHAATVGSWDVAVAWVRVCHAPGLRGALRAVAARAAAYATLLAERVAEIEGHAPAIALPPRVLAAARARYGAADVDDAEKLASLVAGPAGGAAPTAAIEAFAERLTEDAETREMLRLMAAGDHATNTWLAAYRHAAGPRRRAGRL